MTQQYCATVLENNNQLVNQTFSFVEDYVHHKFESIGLIHFTIPNENYEENLKLKHKIKWIQIMNLCMRYVNTKQ